jgi:hypothetical protein
MNRRRETRRPVSILGQVVTKSTTPVFCRVLDVSENGARLKSAQAESLPDTFELELPSEKVARTSEVRWRDGRQVGVKFK